MNEQQRTEQFEQRQLIMLSVVPEEFRSYFAAKAWEFGRYRGYNEVLLDLSELLTGFKEALNKYMTRVKKEDTA